MFGSVLLSQELAKVVDFRDETDEKLHKDVTYSSFAHLFSRETRKVASDTPCERILS